LQRKILGTKLLPSLNTRSSRSSPMDVLLPRPIVGADHGSSLSFERRTGLARARAHVPAGSTQPRAAAFRAKHLALKHVDSSGGIET
jgi:hypothetical protein